MCQDHISTVFLFLNRRLNPLLTFPGDAAQPDREPDYAQGLVLRLFQGSLPGQEAGSCNPSLWHWQTYLSCPAA